MPEVLTWPADLRPATAEWDLILPQTAMTSAFDGSVQTQLLGPERWTVTITTGPMTQAEGARWEAWARRLRGRINRTRIWDWRREAPLGVATGTPVVATAGDGVVGTSLPTSGWTPNVAGILLAGTWVGINGELHLLVADASSDASGNATLAFVPPMRAGPPAGAVITLAKPLALMMLTSISTPTKQDGSRVPSRTLVFEEDISDAVGYTTPLVFAPSISASGITANAAGLAWTAASGGVGTISYAYSLNGGAFVSTGTARTVTLSGLSALTAYSVVVRATDGAFQTVTSSAYTFTTASGSINVSLSGLSAGTLSSSALSAQGVTLSGSAVLVNASNWAALIGGTYPGQPALLLGSGGSASSMELTSGAGCKSNVSFELFDESGAGGSLGQLVGTLTGDPGLDINIVDLGSGPVWHSVSLSGFGCLIRLEFWSSVLVRNIVFS